MNPFFTAALLSLRFTGTRGIFAAEDLFRLSLADLDKLAIKVSKEIKESSEDSFLENPDKKKSAQTKENELRLEILKEVITYKQDQNKAAVAKREAETQRAFLRNLLADKKMAELSGKSAAEIEQMLKDLE